MSDEEVAQVNVEVSASTKELAKKKLEHGGLTRVVRERLTEIAHGTDVSQKEQLQDQLEELREERHQLKTERNRIDEQLDEVERKMERVESRLDELRDKEGEYEGAIQMIEQMMHEESMTVFEDHGRIITAAKCGNCSESDVIQDLRERNPGLDDELFPQEYR